jgi:hypothetical protein
MQKGEGACRSICIRESCKSSLGICDSQDVHAIDQNELGSTNASPPCGHALPRCALVHQGKDEATVLNKGLRYNAESGHIYGGLTVFQMFVRMGPARDRSSPYHVVR